MSKKLMGILMATGLVMVLSLPAFAAPGADDSSNASAEVSSSDVNDDFNEAASEAKEDVTHTGSETEVENEAVK